MKTLRIIGCCCVLAVITASVARGATLASDDFEDYIAGQNLNGANGGAGWPSAWVSSGSDVTVQLLPPANTSLAARVQPVANVANNDSVMSRAFPTSLTTTYVGLTVRPSSIENDDFLIFQVSDGAVGNVAGTLGFGILNTTDNPFFARIGVSGNTTTSSVNALDDQDYRLIAKFSMDAATSFNRVDLFLDPTSSNELDEIPIATRIGPATGLTQLDLFNLRINSFETSDTLFIDDIIISNDFASATGIAAVPEPANIAAWALLGLIAVGYGWRRRRYA